MIEFSDELLKEAINQIAATDAGKVFFAALKEHCRWEQTYTSTENPQVTQYHAAVRGVYGGIRSMIRPEYLKEIEFNYKRKVEHDGSKPKSSVTGRTKPRSARTTSKQ